MSPNQRENLDPYTDRRPPGRQPRQGPVQPPSGGTQQGAPPEQFRGKQSAHPGGTQPHESPGGQRPPAQQPPAQQPASQQQPAQHPSPQQQSAQQPATLQQPTEQPATPQHVSQQPRQQSALAPQQTTGQGNPQGSMAGNQPLQRPAAGGIARGMQRPQLYSAPLDEILQTDVVTVQRETPITQVVETLAAEDVGSVIVVEDEMPVGILTDRNIALALGEMQEVAERTAGELVMGDLVTGTTEMTVLDVLETLEEEAIRRLPIVDEERRLQGIVTLDDILVLLNVELSNVASIIESQSGRY